MNAECNVSTKKQGKFAIIQVNGEITGECDHMMNQSYDSFEADLKKFVIIDMTETSYLNSAGIAVLISVLNKSNDIEGTITLVGMNKHIKSVIETVGLTDFVNVSETLEEALKG